MQGTHPNPIEGAFAAALGLCDRRLGEADSEFLKLETKIDEALRQVRIVSPLAAVAIAPIAEARWDDLSKDYQNLKAEVLGFVEAGTPVLSLISVGLAWNREVLPTVSSMSGKAEAHEANALPAWSGAAYYAYREKREAQGEAIEATTKIVQDLGRWLTELAVRNTRFFLDLVEPVIELIRATAEATMEFVTAAGILEAIGTAAKAIADAAVAIIRVYSNAIAHAVGNIDAINQALVILNDNTKFPGGRWPQAVNRA